MRKTANRLIETVRAARAEGKKLFCAYLTMGFHGLAFTKKMLKRMATDGVDIIELGVPFSDPLADGPVIQHSSEQALAGGVTFPDALKLCRELRREGFKTPLIFFSYYNPIFKMGAKRFTDAIADAGFDGLIVPDLPPDEDVELARLLKARGLCVTYLASPTTSDERLRMIAARSEGFIYYVSLKGVTGVRQSLSTDLKKQIRRIRACTDKAVLIGFGISDAKQAREAAAAADGVIVGSAIIQNITREHARVEKVSTFIRSLVRATRSAERGNKG